MNTSNIVKNETFFIISDKFNWKKGDSFLIGEMDNPQFAAMQNNGFLKNTNNNSIPLSKVLEEVDSFLKTQKKSSLLDENYNYDPSLALQEAIQMNHANMLLLREMIFEEVRIEMFPHLPSRRKSIWVIPKERETLSFWMEKLKTPRSKIFELSLTGKVHRSNPKLLEVVSIPPALIKKTAYQYWLGNMGNDTPQDEIIFEGILNVTKVIDANSSIKNN